MSHCRVATPQDEIQATAYYHAPRSLPQDSEIYRSVRGAMYTRALSRGNQDAQYKRYVTPVCRRNAQTWNQIVQRLTSASALQRQNVQYVTQRLQQLDNACTANLPGILSSLRDYKLPNQSVRTNVESLCQSIEALPQESMTCMYLYMTRPQGTTEFYTGNNLVTRVQKVNLGSEAVRIVAKQVEVARMLCNRVSNMVITPTIAYDACPNMRIRRPGRANTFDNVLFRAISMYEDLVTLRLSDGRTACTTAETILDMLAHAHHRPIALIDVIQNWGGRRAQSPQQIVKTGIVPQLYVDGSSLREDVVVPLISILRYKTACHGP